MDSANSAFVLSPSFSPHLLVFTYPTISVTSFHVRLCFHTGRIILYEQHTAYGAAFGCSWPSDFRLSDEKGWGDVFGVERCLLRIILGWYLPLATR
jgi:hypothetical protein